MRRTPSRLAAAERTSQRTKDLDAELAKLQKKLTDTIAQHSKEASDRVRARLLEYLQAQRHLDQYPDLSVIAVAGKGEILPGFVRRWERS